ncbi:MAG TPA: U32 family peptidase [Sedimentibacter sp.]|jgi:putative protease|nr:U32 family peptidase [Sedimentibacter sp.]HHZ00704.1 U32 family peptidase [Tissierellia bacterium]HOK48720.1 U32 family peptidase [Sedimentibacter sp.]HOW23309.1 U32 family peptidase [Sedimentibacter sp.]HRC81134.1 U32 family peptidase [Sedimentibacter sp.]
MLPKLLAPAGNLDKLIMAVQYGADEVYFAGKSLGMRAGGRNFSRKDLEQGVDYCHKHGRRAHVTVNIVPHNDDLKGIEEYLKYLWKIGTDALIVADPGVIEIVKQTIPDMRIHLSTQANTTNYHAANFWYKQGVNRIVLARELTFEEIETIVKNTPKDLEFETFVHGAMCISYSGRCLLSSFMTGRFSNKGDCAQCCRWKYYLVEEKRPGEYYPIEENDEGTFIMNSKDMCMIEHLQKFKDLGIKALKIEGRNKSEYYTALTVRAYRNALDELELPENQRNTAYWKEELEKTSHRDFSYGFYFGNPYRGGQTYTSSSYIRPYDVVGIIRSYDAESKIATVEQRNKFSEGDVLECFGPRGRHFELIAKDLRDEENNKIDSAPHPQQIVKLHMTEHAEPYFILRKKVEE